MFTRRGLAGVAAVLVLLQARTALPGQSLVRPLSAGPAPGAVVGRSVLLPRTTSITKLDDLVRAGSGNVSPTAYARFKTFPAYWRAAESSWAGKAFEALVAFDENERMSVLGRTERVLVTSVEGAPWDPADLWLVSGDRIVGKSQAKLGWRAA